MKSVDLGFAVSAASLQSCLSGGAESLDWIELQMHAVEDQVLCDEEGRELEITQWQMNVLRVSDGHPIDEAGFLSCSTSMGSLCKAKVRMNGPQFDMILQALVSGKRVEYVHLSVLGLKEAGSTLIWRRAGEIDLPVQMVGIRTVLYDMQNEINEAIRSS